MPKYSLESLKEKMNGIPVEMARLLNLEYEAEFEEERFDLILGEFDYLLYYYFYSTESGLVLNSDPLLEGFFNSLASLDANGGKNENAKSSISSSHFNSLALVFKDAEAKAFHQGKRKEAYIELVEICLSYFPNELPLFEFLLEYLTTEVPPTE
jgi:hypothetical protein